jgi:hypothetical protein
MARILTVQIYSFNELSVAAQKWAIEAFRFPLSEEVNLKISNADIANYFIENDSEFLGNGKLW